LQQPNQTAGVTGGRPDDWILQSGNCSRVDGIFWLKRAKSDGANMHIWLFWGFNDQISGY
jgi:hypothetical protein